MTFKKLSDSEWSYEGYDEPESDRTRTFKYFLQVGVSFKETQLQQKSLTVHRVFRWLVDFDTDHNKAWRYATWKYGIGTSYLSIIYYNPSLGSDGLVEMNDPKYSRTMQLGPGAFTNENECASIILHENVHGGQDKATWPNYSLYNKNEREAYMAEMKSASKTNIDGSYYRRVVQDYINHGGKQEDVPEFPNGNN